MSVLLLLATTYPGPCVQLDVPTLVVQQRRCTTEEGAALLGCLTHEEQALPGGSYLLVSPDFQAMAAAQKQSQAELGAQMPLHPPTPPPPAQEPLCSPLSPLPTLLAASYLAARESVRLQDVEAALLGLGKEALFGCTARFEPTRRGTAGTPSPADQGTPSTSGDGHRDGTGEGASKREGRGASVAASSGLPPGAVRRWLRQGFLLSVQDMGRGHQPVASAGTTEWSRRRESEGGQSEAALGGASDGGPGFVSRGALWEAAGESVREARGELQVRGCNPSPHSE